MTKGKGSRTRQCRKAKKKTKQKDDMNGNNKGTN